MAGKASGGPPIKSRVLDSKEPPPKRFPGFGRQPGSANLPANLGLELQVKPDKPLVSKVGLGDNPLFGITPQGDGGIENQTAVTTGPGQLDIDSPPKFLGDRRLPATSRTSHAVSIGTVDTLPTVSKSVRDISNGISMRNPVLAGFAPAQAFTVLSHEFLGGNIEAVTYPSKLDILDVGLVYKFFTQLYNPPLTCIVCPVM